MKHLFKYTILFLGLVVLTFGCQKDDTPTRVEDTQIESIKAFHISKKEIPAHILGYVKEKTGNTFRVDFAKNRILLTNAAHYRSDRETPLGTVLTNKVVQVYNENNIKYTFKVQNPTNANSVINLVVVDIEGTIVEYFIQYVFDDISDAPTLASGAIDMSAFTGTMIFHNDVGDIIGVYTFENGSTINFNGTTNPCSDDTVDYEDTGTTTTGGGGTENGSDDGVDNTANGSTGCEGCGNNESFDQADCVDIVYGDCGCGDLGPNDGHAATGNPCCNGSPVIAVTDNCSGNSYAYRFSARELEDPCAGDVGILLEYVDDCKKLKQNITDLPLIKTRLHTIKVESENSEKGLRVDIHPDTGAYTPTQILDDNNDTAHINITVNPYTVVIAHSHPPSADGYYAMYSGPDILKMGEITKHIQNSVLQTVPTIDITHILIADGKTFAIRFDDAASVQKLLSIFENKRKKKEFERNLKNKYESDNTGYPLNQSTTTIEKQQKHLYKLLSKYGLNMSLYQANYDDNGFINDWQKLNKDNLEKEPCN
ncbi:hypothetical protein [Psychroserpens sp. MEBiC05023]